MDLRSTERQNARRKSSDCNDSGSNAGQKHASSVPDRTFQEEPRRRGKHARHASDRKIQDQIALAKPIDARE
jgi:hypothetical protein